LCREMVSRGRRFVREMVSREKRFARRYKEGRLVGVPDENVREEGARRETVLRRRRRERMWQNLPCDANRFATSEQLIEPAQHTRRRDVRIPRPPSLRPAP
jgi:Mn-dependent DtxR family transcriptional regulator